MNRRERCFWSNLFYSRLKCTHVFRWCELCAFNPSPRRLPGELRRLSAERGKNWSREEARLLTAVFTSFTQAKSSALCPLTDHNGFYYSMSFINVTQRPPEIHNKYCPSSQNSLSSLSTRPFWGAGWTLHWVFQRTGKQGAHYSQVIRIGIILGFTFEKQRNL